MKILKITTLKKGWHDRNELMLHAAFQILVDYVERERPGEVINWNWNPAHKQAWKEIRSLYRWWTQTRPKRKHPERDEKITPPPTTARQRTLEKRRSDRYWEREAKWEAEDQANLHRLVEVRQYLWT